MNSNFIISWLHVILLTGAGIVALIVQKWLVGSVVLSMAFALGLFVRFLDQRDRNRRP